MSILDVPQPPDPESLLKLLLSTAGVSSTIIALMSLAFVLSNWFGATKSAIEVAKFARRTTKYAYRLRPVQGLLSVMVLILVPAAQILTLCLCYLGGNYVALIFDQPRWRRVLNTLTTDPALRVDSDSIFQVLQPHWLRGAYDAISPLLQLDWISGSYVALAGFLIIMSYPWSIRSDDRLDMAGKLVALPATVLLLMAYVGAILYALVTLLSFGIFLLSLLAGVHQTFGEWAKETLVTAIPLIVGAAGCGLYYWACQAAVRGSGLVTGTWHPRGQINSNAAGQQ